MKTACITPAVPSSVEDARRLVENYVRTSLTAGKCLAIIADQEKDHARRDELLSVTVKEHATKAPMTFAVVRNFLDTVFAPEGAAGRLNRSMSGPVR
jgi:hypothetical protein